MKRHIEHIASAACAWCAHPAAFVVASALTILWMISGPYFGWSDTWQLYANTTTTIVTFLIGFLILNQERRGTQALHLELRELIRAMPEARTRLVEERLEEAPEDVLRAEEAELQRLAAEDEGHVPP